MVKFPENTVEAVVVIRFCLSPDFNLVKQVFYFVTESEGYCIIIVKSLKALQSVNAMRV